MSITASITVPDGGANGVLLAQGGAFGGLQPVPPTDGRPADCYNLYGIERIKIYGDHPVPAGDHQVRAEFTYDGGGLAKGGDLALYVDGTKVGQVLIEHTVPMIFSADETTDVGTDAATSVSDDYDPKTAAFTGQVHWVQLDTDSADVDQSISPDERLRIALALANSDDRSSDMEERLTASHAGVLCRSQSRTSPIVAVIVSSISSPAAGVAVNERRALIRELGPRRSLAVMRAGPGRRSRTPRRSGRWLRRLHRRTCRRVTDHDVGQSGLLEDRVPARVQHAAPRDDSNELVSLEGFMGRCEQYFAGSGTMVDQPFIAGVVDGMVRAYLVGGTVVGYALRQPEPSLSAAR